MNRHKNIITMCLVTLVIAFFAMDRAQAMPASPTDESKVPHYYGPFPNWVLSQLPTVTPGTCSATTATVCTTDANCPTTETCVAASATGGIKKFVDGLPMLCDPTVGCTDNNLGQHIPLAVPDTTTFTKVNKFQDDADYYVIALVQHREKMSSSLPGLGTLQREYVQLSTGAVPGKSVALMNDLPDGTSVAALMPDGSAAVGVDAPHYMGPIIAATKNRPVRIVFYNLLPTGAGGDLFLPVDTSFMGSGMGPMAMMPPMDDGTVMDMVRNPMCGELDPITGVKPSGCFTDNRASIHLHGGTTPWISDGSPHQWITPANETTGWPEGVAVRQVPDMVKPAASTLGVPNCSAAADGCTTFYYTNQQSARLMFYHDHAWGITRLNVYAGEAAGYLIRDNTEQALIDGGLIPSGADEIPLVIQDRTFIPNPAQMAAQDPTWDYTRWGKEGDLWYEHVYMPAQNPNDQSGASPYGRWFYGPYFWPPATPQYGPIANPYYNASCDLGDPTSWTYQVPPYCEPPTIPGTPNNSAGMEQFNDTPIVNGTAYPTITVGPKAYRFRILNAANDRFFNLQMYVGDPKTIIDTNIGPTEVALKRTELAAAQEDPNNFPTPDTLVSPAGPAWLQIGSEGGFLPTPAVIPNQPTTWIIDPTRFDVGNVDKHSLALGPAERADVIVDFSDFAGQTLILYNDAPAAYPGRISTYDYYTGAPDLSPAGAPTVMPGYGPNTRTIMQIKVSGSGGAATPNYVNPATVTSLTAAFAHHADGTGVFESGQHPIIVGQAAYNSAYGTTFTTNGWCNNPAAPLTAKCDGFARISEQGLDIFKFNTLLNSKIGVQIEPKALHDETNATDFEPYGRMSGNIGVEAVPATPLAQTIVLYPFVNPPTELFNGTNLPRTDTVTPIAKGDDGTQIWKITHNGVDTHPIHFHLYDVQVLNRVTWDNIIIKPDPNELGWKDTVRVSPLEDTYFAIRPIIPTIPFEIPNSIRPMNPMMPLHDTSMFNSVDISGNPTNPITNELVNFGWEYMLHCHILSHEEMDMMRPVSVALPPIAPSIVSATLSKKNLVLTWKDNSITETQFVVQRNDGFGWVDLGIFTSPLNVANTEGVNRTFTDTKFNSKLSYNYRVAAQNTIGYGGQYPSLTAQSVSALQGYGTPATTPPAAPSNMAVTAVKAKNGKSYTVTMTWTDNSTNEAGFQIQWATDATFTTVVGSYTTGPNAKSYVTIVSPSAKAYYFRVRATNAVNTSAWSTFGPVPAP